MRPIAYTFVAALSVLTACATGDSSTPGLDGSPDLTPITAEVTSLPSADSIPADSAAASTVAPADAPTSVLAPETTSAPTAPPIGNANSDAAKLDAACATLRTAGYETRKAAISSLGDTDVSTVKKTCAEDLQRLLDSLAVEGRVDAINANAQAIDVIDLTCESTSFTVSVRNNMSDAVGIHANFFLTEEGSVTPVASGTEPIVIWSLAPGESQEISGSYTEITDGRKFACNFGLHAFDATPGDADASLGVTAQPELTGDDPAMWFPALIAYEIATTRSGDADRAAVTEDIRSTAYRTVVDTTSATADPYEAPTRIVVCPSTVVMPDADHVSLVYSTESPNGNRLRHGLFRRGADDQWRWLGVARYVDTPSLYSCGRPTPGL